MTTLLEPAVILAGGRPPMPNETVAPPEAPEDEESEED